MTPVYNGEKFLREMMDSILVQTMQDFEWVIINDGSTDSTEQIIKSYTDSRIRYYANDGNQGIAYSFNRAIELSTGDFLAVAEADDVNHPRRLEIQIAYMVNNKNVGLLSGRQKVFSNQSPKFIKISNPQKIGTTAKENKNGILFYGASVVHASAVYRKSVLIKHNIRYNKKYKISCDYEVFTRMSRVTDVIKLSCFLLNYRVHENNASKSRKDSISETNEIYREFLLREFGFNMHGELISESTEITRIEFLECVEAINYVLLKTKKHSEYDYNFTRRAASILAHKHWKGVVKFGLNNKQAFQLYRQTPLLHYIDATKKTRIWIKFFAWHLGLNL